jgi:hypothetical protein
MAEQTLPDASEPSVATSRQSLPDKVWAVVEQSLWAQGAARFYQRHEQYAPAFFFFGGVAWDASTLRRIDAWFDNVFLLAYLSLLGACITLAVLAEHNQVRHSWVLKYKTWLPAVIQFFLGALFSAYVIYYSQSASLTETSLYLLLLVGLLIANEFVHRRLVNLYLLFALYFLAAFSFFIFLVPTLTRSIGYFPFLAGGLLAVALVGSMLRYLNRRDVFAMPRQYYLAQAMVVALFGIMNLFYLQNWIPPVPLAMRHGGIYHELERQGATYELYYERPPWYKFWVKSDEVFRYGEGNTVYCFAAIFAPTSLRTEVFHEWQYFDETRREWLTTDRIGYALTGGRDAGYRGHTLKRRLAQGKWRVEVQTAGGRTLGRIPFQVVPAEEPVRDLARLIYD